MVFEILDNLIDQRINRGAPSIHDALAADLDDVDPGQDGEVGSCAAGTHQRRVGKRTAGDLFA